MSNRFKEIKNFLSCATHFIWTVVAVVFLGFLFIVGANIIFSLAQKASQFILTLINN